MRFYLDRFIGDGRSITNGPAHLNGDDSFRVASAGPEYSNIIDLRGDKTRQEGLCLAASETLVGTPVLDLGDTLDQRLTGKIKNLLEGHLGLTLDQTDFRSVIAELCLLHGRNDGTRWGRLRAMHTGWHRINLGRQVVYHAPAVQNTVLTEDWNCVDSSSLSCDLTWTEVENGASSELLTRSSGVFFIPVIKLGMETVTNT